MLSCNAAEDGGAQRRGVDRCALRAVGAWHAPTLQDCAGVDARAPWQLPLAAASEAELHEDPAGS
eukprot:7858300-Alexandrium_andersonii.AAC.1